MFSYAGGGIASWGTICGTLAVAGAVINLVNDTEVATQLINELMAWYIQHPFPEYQPEFDLVTTVSGSTLCHVSASKWCDASGFKISDDERKARCAAVAAEVAKFSAELLNKQIDNEFEPQYAPAATISECMGCHGPDGMNDTIGKMDCGLCHEPHD